MRIRRMDDIGDNSLFNHHLSSFRIHRYGTSITNSEDNPAVHSFTVDNTKPISSTGLSLSLSADYEGVVGRGISIVDGNGIVLGSGVIGWN